MEVTTSEKVVVTLRTDMDTRLTLTIYDTNQEMDAEEFNGVMEAIVGKEVLQDEAGNLATVVEAAERVVTTTSRMW